MSLNINTLCSFVNVHEWLAWYLGLEEGYKGANVTRKVTNPLYSIFHPLYTCPTLFPLIQWTPRGSERDMWKILYFCTCIRNNGQYSPHSITELFHSLTIFFTSYLEYEIIHRFLSFKKSKNVTHNNYWIEQSAVFEYPILVIYLDSPMWTWLALVMIV